MGCRGERVPQEDHQGDQLRRVATFFMLLSMIGLALADQNSAFHDGRGLGQRRIRAYSTRSTLGRHQTRYRLMGLPPPRPSTTRAARGNLPDQA